MDIEFFVRRTRTSKMTAPVTALMASGNKTSADVDARSGQYVARDHCANEANDPVTDDAQDPGLDNETGERTDDDADDNPDCDEGRVPWHLAPPPNIYQILATSPGSKKPTTGIAVCCCMRRNRSDEAHATEKRHELAPLHVIPHCNRGHCETTNFRALTASNCCIAARSYRRGLLSVAAPG
jgi:hypothetical protein